MDIGNLRLLTMYPRQHTWPNSLSHECFLMPILSNLQQPPLSCNGWGCHNGWCCQWLERRSPSSSVQFTCCHCLDTWPGMNRAGRRPTSPKILEVLNNDEQLVPTFSLGEQKSPITKGWGVRFDSKLYLTNPLAYTALKTGPHSLDHISQCRPTISLLNDT